MYQALGSGSDLEFQTGLSRRLTFGVDAEVRTWFDGTKSVERRLSALVVKLQSRL